MRKLALQLTQALLLISALLTTCSPALSQQKSESSPWQRPESSRALFESLGLKLDEVEDRKEKSDKDLELYLRILTRLRQLPTGITYDWAGDQPELKTIEEEPGKFRGEMFNLKGNLRSFDRIDLPQELSDRFDVKTLYKLMFGIPKIGPRPDGPVSNEDYFYVWTSHLPSQFGRNWIHDPKCTFSRVSSEAVFIAIVIDYPHKGDLGHPNFVANHVAWFPEGASQELHVSSSLAALGRAKFDIGLLDTIKYETSKRLTAELTEPFHQMLAAQSRVDWASLKAAPLELGKLVSSPNDFVGEAIEFDAVARRVVEIPIDIESDRKRLQLDRYFQVDLVIPKPIRTLVKDKEGIEHEVQQENFPLTLCTIEPPPGLIIGEDIREPIRAKAFFFKLWAYESKFAQAQSVDTMQVSPLFISATLERIPPPELATSSLIWLICGATGILAAIALWGYLLIRSDDQRERQQKHAIADSIQPVEISQTSADAQ